MPIATITSKGQVTIPKEVRDHLHMGAGSKLEFRVQDDGTVTLNPLEGSLDELFGFLHRPGKAPVSLEEMDRAVAAGRAADDERIRRGG